MKDKRHRKISQSPLADDDCLLFFTFAEHRRVVVAERTSGQGLWEGTGADAVTEWHDHDRLTHDTRQECHVRHRSGTYFRDMLAGFILSCLPLRKLFLPPTHLQFPNPTLIRIDISRLRLFVVISPLRNLWATPTPHWLLPCSTISRRFSATAATRTV